MAVGIELSQQASLNKQSYRYVAHTKSLWNSSPNPCPNPRLICTSKYSFHMPAKSLVGHHHSLNQPGICPVMPTRRLAEQHGFTSVTRCVVQGVPGTPKVIRGNIMAPKRLFLRGFLKLEKVKPPPPAPKLRITSAELLRSQIGVHFWPP